MEAEKETEQLRIVVGKISEIADRMQYFEKLQFLNDELAKKRIERAKASDEFFVARVEFSKKQFALERMISEERVPGFKKLKYEKAAEKKAEVQLRIFGDPVLLNAQDKVNRLETRVKIYDLAVDWLQKEIRIWQSFVDTIGTS